MLLQIILYSYISLAQEPKQGNLSINMISSLKWEPLRIYFQITHQVDQQRKLIQLLDQVSIFFYKTILVRRNEEEIDLSKIKLKIELDLSDKEVFENQKQDSDIIIFVSVKNMTGYLATCNPVNFDTITKRPNVCELFLKNGLQFKSTNFAHQKILKTLIHETIHCLGLDRNVYKLFYNSSSGDFYNQVIFTNQSTNFLQLNRSKEYLKYYFNCDQISGIQMENQGQNKTIGNHFEQSIFLNDIMQGTQFNDVMISQLTLFFLQDTGFYQLAEHKADKIFYGQNRGCEFLQQQCNSKQFTEFCQDQNKRGCSFTNSGIASCQITSLSGQCKSYQVIDDWNCKDDNKQKAGSKILQYFGHDSICVEGSLSKKKLITDFTCQQFTCDVNDNMILIVDKLKLNCSQSDSLFNNTYYGKIQCPSNSKKICQNDNSCLNHCSQQGICVNKECICSNGYSGQDCSEQCEGYRYKGECHQECPQDSYALELIKYCVGCPGYCKKCNSYNNCTQCEENFTLVSGFCDFAYTKQQDIYQSILMLIIWNIFLFQ